MFLGNVSDRRISSAVTEKLQPDEVVAFQSPVRIGPLLWWMRFERTGYVIVTELRVFVATTGWLNPVISEMWLDDIRDVRQSVPPWGWIEIATSTQSWQLSPYVGRIFNYPDDLADRMIEA